MPKSKCIRVKIPLLLRFLLFFYCTHKYHTSHYRVPYSGVKQVNFTLWLSQSTPKSKGSESKFNIKGCRKWFTFSKGHYTSSNCRYCAQPFKGIEFRCSSIWIGALAGNRTQSFRVVVFRQCRLRSETPKNMVKDSTRRCRSHSTTNGDLKKELNIAIGTILY